MGIKMKNLILCGFTEKSLIFRGKGGLGAGWWKRGGWVMKNQYIKGNC